MLNIFIFRKKYHSKVKELKKSIKALKKEIELLRRSQNSVPQNSLPQNNVEASNISDLYIASSQTVPRSFTSQSANTSDISNNTFSPIYPACNYDELIRFRPKDQTNDIVILTSTPIDTPIDSLQLQAEIDDFLNHSSNSFDNLILI